MTNTELALVNGTLKDQRKNALAQKQQEFEWALCNEAIKEAFTLLLKFLFISTVAGITTRTVEYFKH